MRIPKNFLIAFAVGFVLFGVLALMLPGRIRLGGEKSGSPSQTPTDVPAFSDVTEGEGESADETEKASLTAVVGGYDAERGELDALLVIKVDPEKERFLAAALPTGLSVPVMSTDPVSGVSVQTNVRIKDFPILYGKSGKVRKIVDTVRVLTGMNVDHYAFFSTGTALDLFDKTGGLYYEVPQDMVFVGNGTEENPQISLSAGGQVLNKKQILDLLSFSYYTTDEARNNAARADVQADFLVKGLKQIVSAEPNGVMAAAVQLLAGCETDFSAADLAVWYPVVASLLESGAQIVTVTPPLTDPVDFAGAQKFFENYR